MKELLEWLKAVAPLLLAVSAALMAANQWVHRRERKEQAIDTEMHGKPSLASKIETLAVAFRERNTSTDVQLADIKRAHDGLRETVLGDAPATVRGRLHSLEDWRQSFGTLTTERIEQNAKSLERVQKQLDKAWLVRTKGADEDES